MDWDFWVSVALETGELRDDPDGVAYIVFRFVDQYLPAWFAATDDDKRERVWTALWGLLTATATGRKPVQLSPDSADLLIARIRQALSARLQAPD